MNSLLRRTNLAAAAALASLATMTAAVVGSAAVAADAQPHATGASSPAAATWAQIDKNLQQLESLIQAGKLGDLGPSAYGIANLFKTLPAQSSALPPDQLAQVQADVKTVGSEVSKLDKAGEGNDPVGVRSHLQALKTTLASARAVYQR